jgi:hypothetical protein
MVKQNKDTGGAIIPLLGYNTSGSRTVAFNNITASSTSFGVYTDVITITPSTSCFIQFSSSNVAANTSSHYFVGGLPYDIVLKESNTLSVLGVTSGTLYISERI